MIQTWFLTLSLFFPRLAIFIAWLSFSLPVWSGAPWLIKFLMAGFIPRILILIYIATIMGFCVWFWVHLIVTILVWGECSSKFSDRD